MVESVGERRTRRMEGHRADLTSNLDPVAQMTGEWCRLWFAELSRERTAIAQCENPNEVQQAFAVYRQAKKMVQLGIAFS